MSGTPDLDRAVMALQRGGLVAFPTETVYGLGADATDADALTRLYTVKGRPTDHPVIVHLAAAAALDDWAVGVPPVARELAARFWPGPVTLVLAAAPAVSRLATGGLDTVGLRVPAHPVALELLDAFGGAIAAPSANRFGRVSPTTADAVRRDLGADVDVVLDGGACTVGVESTIVDVTFSWFDTGTLDRERALALARGATVSDTEIERHPALLATRSVTGSGCSATASANPGVLSWWVQIRGQRDADACADAKKLLAATLSSEM